VGIKTLLRQSVEQIIQFKDVKEYRLPYAIISLFLGISNKAEISIVSTVLHIVELVKRFKIL